MFFVSDFLVPFLHLCDPPIQFTKFFSGFPFQLPLKHTPNDPVHDLTYFLPHFRHGTRSSEKHSTRSSSQTGSGLALPVTTPGQESSQSAGHTEKEIGNATRSQKTGSTTLNSARRVTSDSSSVQDANKTGSSAQTVSAMSKFSSGNVSAKSDNDMGSITSAKSDTSKTGPASAIKPASGKYNSRSVQSSKGKATSRMADVKELTEVSMTTTVASIDTQKVSKGTPANTPEVSVNEEEVMQVLKKSLSAADSDTIAAHMATIKESAEPRDDTVAKGSGDLDKVAMETAEETARYFRCG